MLGKIDQWGVGGGGGVKIVCNEYSWEPYEHAAQLNDRDRLTADLLTPFLSIVQQCVREAFDGF